MPLRSTDADDLAFRMGAGALGLFTGAALGLFVAWLGYIVVGAELSFVKGLVGGAAAGLLSGLVLPVEAMSMVEAVLHFFIGFFAAAADERVESSIETPSYLKLAGVFGSALVLALFILSLFY
jgi:hypothetical protein